MVDFRRLLDTEVTLGARDLAHAVTAPKDDDVDDPPPPPVEPPLEIPDPLLSPASYLCGAAGCGKTYLARAMTRQLPGTVLAATTGIAAVNLGEGTTINALLSYFDTASLRDSFVSGFLIARLGKLWKAGVRRILLDEVSMMDGEQLTILTKALDELSGRGYVRDVKLLDDIRDARDDAGDDTEDADGLRSWPIALTLIGDFAQLPPVKAPFAFESSEWPRYAAHVHRLTKIWRQSDAAFITALQAARRGDADTVCDYFGPQLQQETDPNFDGPTLYATNDEVARFNFLRMAKLTGKGHTYAPSRWGVQRGDWKQIPDALDLKVGALVMILANQRLATVDGMPGRLIYANGDLGTIVALEEHLVHIELQRNHQTVEVNYIRRENQIPLEPGRARQLREEGKQELLTPEKSPKFEIVGTVDYLPVRVAYATTIHRSQGLSLDAVQVNMRAGFFKTPGMIYVALSRSRTAAGLRIVGSVGALRERCTVHPKIVGWL